MAERDCSADLGVGTLGLVIDSLAHVVEQPAHLGRLDVATEFGGDDRGQPARLDGVDEDVLAVAGAVLEPTEQLDDLRGQGRNAGVVDGLLTGLAHDQVHFCAGLGNDFFDSSGVDASVGQELENGLAGHFPADGIEA